MGTLESPGRAQPVMTLQLVDLTFLLGAGPKFGKPTSLLRKIQDIVHLNSVPDMVPVQEDIVASGVNKVLARAATILNRRTTAQITRNTTRTSTRNSKPAPLRIDSFLYSHEIFGKLTPCRISYLTSFRPRSLCFSKYIRSRLWFGRLSGIQLSFIG